MDEIRREFPEIAQIINKARGDAFQRVNEVLILMYNEIGKYLSEQSKTAIYGDAYVDSLSEYIQHEFPGIKGFTRRGLYRMKQFYEAYEGNEIVSTLLTQLSWSNHLTIL